MALKLNPKGPLMLGALAIAGLWLFNKARAQPTTQQRAVQSRSQAYSTPTSVAAALGAFINATTRGATPTVRQDNVVNTNWKPWGEQATVAGKQYIEENPQLGVFTFGAGVGGNIDAAWKPNYSFVNVPDNGGRASDDFAVVPVYDTGTDWVNNPTNMWGNA